MENNDIKYREAGELKCYLGTLNRRERAKFIKWIAHECMVSRPVVYSWCYMCARIPDFAKRIIERCAGTRVFDLNVITFDESDFLLDDDTTQT